MKLRIKLKAGFKKVLKLRDKPVSVARGFALGSFIGMMPIPGFQMMLALLVSSMIRVNRKAACIAVFNTNLATGLFVFAFNFWLGKKILFLEIDFIMPERLGFGFIKAVLDSGFDVFICMTVGGIVTGIIVSVLTYHLVLRILKKHNRGFITEKKHSAYALITGASQGLGECISNELASQGKNLILVSLPGENLSSVCEYIKKKYDVKVHIFELDLTNDTELRCLVEDVNSKFNVDVLINNAGAGGSQGFSESTTKYLDNIIMLNMRSLVLLTRLMMDNLIRQRNAYILNIASMASFIPIPFKTVYPASKAFVYSFSRAMSAELKAEGVSVSVAHPGGMATNKDVSARIEQYSKIVKSGMLSPKRTAQICVKSMYKGKNLIVPGVLNKLTYVIFKIVPINIQLRILSKSIQKELSLKQSVSV